FQLCDLYENDSIFDKFDCCLSGDGLRVATGSYSNIFRVFGCTPGSNEATTLEATKNPTRYFNFIATVNSETSSYMVDSAFTCSLESCRIDANGNSCDFTTKSLHLAWHPTENSIACAAMNSLYMYYS
ncbi:hypothetical protein GW17_00019992, partial [Ensete ventricosum]